MRNLRYLQITQAQARSFDFSWVMENSWDTARWSNDQSLVLVHWVEPIAAPFTAWMSKNRIRPDSITTQVEENNYIRERSGKTIWDSRPTPPREKK